MKNQRGSILVFTLVILLVMTLLGMTAMRTSILEEKIAGNNHNQKTAFQAADSALNETEKMLQAMAWQDNLATKFSREESGYYNQIRDSPNVHNSNNWSRTTTFSAALLPGTPNAPQITVENLGITLPLVNQNYSSNSERATQISRITVRATGTTESAVVILQSYLRKELTP